MRFGTGSVVGLIAGATFAGAFMGNKFVSDRQTKEKALDTSDEWAGFYEYSGAKHWQIKRSGTNDILMGAGAAVLGTPFAAGALLTNGPVAVKGSMGAIAAVAGTIAAYEMMKGFMEISIANARIKNDVEGGYPGFEG